jgi:2-polyprenyl-3-methyl-5-hydroxy-6-metoxy-1,4-benzoquinol methylase
MPLIWIDVTPLSFNSLLLLEKVQLSWFRGWLPEAELGVALRANPAVLWFMRHKCPALDAWLVGVVAAQEGKPPASPEEIRGAEVKVMQTIMDLLTYALDPAAYDALPFLGWDGRELASLADFAGKVALDIGSGTGRLAFIAAPQAAAVYAVEPVGNLRDYIKQKARSQGYQNVFAVDGLVTDLPFQDGFADVTMGGHVFGDNPEAEYEEMRRVTKSGGMIILCPGNNDRDDEAHQFLVDQGFAWGRFEEPEEGLKRKYWKTLG